MYISACQYKKPFQLCLTTDVKRFSNGTFNSSIESRPTDTQRGTCRLETVQDFLIKLGIKPLMYLLEISIFSPPRQTYKNYEQSCQRSQNSEFQSHFSVSKIG